MIRLRQIGLPASNLTKSANYFKDAHINKGDTVTITNLDSTPVGIDLVDLEKAPDAIRQPENSVSITDFGAIANDGSDDYQAFMAAIESAKASKKICLHS